MTPFLGFSKPLISNIYAYKCFCFFSYSFPRNRSKIESVLIGAKLTTNFKCKIYFLKLANILCIMFYI